MTKVEKLITAVDNVCGKSWREDTRVQEAVDGRMIFAYLCRKHCHLKQADISMYLRRCRSQISQLQTNAVILIDRDKKVREKCKETEKMFLSMVD